MIATILAEDESAGATSRRAGATVRRTTQDEVPV
jgi:hypothetical protein